jgi:radical SAM protein with 4Fe4S-binding SPASM domain
VRVVAWELTRACNLSCPYCRASSVDRDSDAASTAEALAALDQIALLGRPLIILSGGEPLLRDDLAEIASASARMGFPTAVATNGTLMTPERARELAAAGVRRVSVSLDFPDGARHDAVRGAGSFDAALAGIEALKGAGLPFQVNMTVSSGNSGDVPAMLELACRLGAAAFHLFFVVDVGRAEGRRLGLDSEGYERVLTETAHLERAAQIEMRVTCAPQYARIKASLGFESRSGRPSSSPCMAGRGFLFISATGEIKPCGYFDMVVARLSDGPLDVIWAENPILESLRHTETFGGRCGICTYVHACGGCRARALAATADFLSEDPACVYNCEMASPGRDV